MQDSNQIALDVVRSILDAAHPATLDVAGTLVTTVVSRDPPAASHEPRFNGSVAQAVLPAPVRAACAWDGGNVTLVFSVVRETVPRYQGDVCLGVHTGTCCILWCNVRAAVDRAASGEPASLTALAALVKRGPAAAEQPSINRALRRMVSEAGLPMPTKSKVQIAEAQLPGGQIEGGADAAFARALLVSLLKHDFVDRRGAAKRGVPLIDFTKLDLSEAA